MKVEERPDPTSLVDRILAELRGNSEAQQMLLEAVLENEFEGVPACLYGIREDVAEITNRVGWDESISLADGDLEHRLHGRVAGLMRRVLEVRRARIIQAPTQGPTSGFLNEVESALEDGRITEGQEWRIDQTDFIIRAQRRADGVPVWIAIEASFTVRRKDVIRARASADALRAVFGAETLAVVAGYGIDAANAAQAEAAGVAYLQVPRPGQE